MLILNVTDVIFFSDWKKGHNYQPLSRHRRDISSTIQIPEKTELYVSEPDTVFSTEYHTNTAELNERYLISNNVDIDDEFRDSESINDKTEDDNNKNEISLLETFYGDVNKNSEKMNFMNERLEQIFGTVPPKAVPIHEIVLGERRPSSEDPLPPGTSITRRKRWLEQYLQDIESGHLDKRLHERHEDMQRRRKRSIASGVEGQSFTNVSVAF